MIMLKEKKKKAVCIGEDLEKRELIHYSWGYKMVQSVWRKDCQFL